MKSAATTTMVPCTTHKVKGTMTTLIPSKLTDEVVASYKNCPDPRLQEIMISLVKHLHSFAREVKLTTRMAHRNSPKLVSRVYTIPLPVSVFALT